MERKRAGTNAKAVTRNRAALLAYWGMTPKENQAEKAPPPTVEDEERAETYTELLLTVKKDVQVQDPTLFEQDAD